MKTILVICLLMVLQSFTSSLQTNENIIQNTTHYIGEEFKDGIVFFVYLETDGSEHGLIVCKEEQLHTRWQNRASLVDATSMVNGLMNSSKIIGSPAITYVHHIGESWYLPSINELGLLWRSRNKIESILLAVGQSLSKTIYWSSTEHAELSALGFNFDGGYSGDPSFKTKHFTVRAIKSF